MKISDYKGYEIHLPTSGGKAGKGCAVTSNIQLRQGNCIVKQFQFVVANPESRKLAAQKAREWADQQVKEPFKKGDWVGELETTQPMIGTVRECYPDDLKPGTFLIDLVCYAPHGEKIGRKSPACDGPTGFEPCISASRFAKIEKPAFPLEIARFSKSWNVSFLK